MDVDIVFCQGITSGVTFFFPWDEQEINVGLVPNLVVGHTTTQNGRDDISIFLDFL